MTTSGTAQLRLRRFLVLMLLLAALVRPAHDVASAQSGETLIQPRGDAALSGVMPGDGPANAPETLWQYEPGAGTTMGMASDGGTIYVVTKKPGALVALDIADGTVRWTFDSGGDTA